MSHDALRKDIIPLTSLPYFTGSACIRFERLDELFKEVEVSDHVVYHIDAESILFRLYRKRTLGMLSHSEREYLVVDLVIGFMNVLAHYRLYTASRLQAKSTILIYWNYILPEYQKSYYKNYRKNYYEKYDFHHPDYSMINTVIFSAMKMIRNMVQYIDHIYWISNENIDTFTVMYYILHNTKFRKSKYTNILFTRNVFATQMIDHHIYQLYQRKQYDPEDPTHKIDTSFLIHPGNVYKNGIFYGHKISDIKEIPTEFLPIIWSVSRCSDIDVKPLGLYKTINSAYDIVRKLYEKEVLDPQDTIQQFLSKYKEHVPKKKREAVVELEEDIIRYHKFLSLEIASYSIQKQQRTQLFHDWVDLYDQPALEKINEVLAFHYDSPAQNLINFQALNLTEPLFRQSNKDYNLSSMIDYME